MERWEAPAQTGLVIPVQRYGLALAGACGGQPPAARAAAFSYSSGVTDHGEAAAVAASLPGTPLQAREAVSVIDLGR